MQIMGNAKIAMVIDTRRAKANNLFPVKLRVTFERKQKYYPTRHNLTEAQFKRAMYGERQTNSEKTLKKEIEAYEVKAAEIIKDLPYFDWYLFEKQYFRDRSTSDEIEAAYNERVNELKASGQIGTAVTYENAKKSLNEYKTGLKFRDITPELLKQYENWMLGPEKGNSKTTVSMYLRTLRTFFNVGIENKTINPEAYPFSRKKNDKGYKIPTGSNIKKALALDEIAKIYNFDAEPGSTTDMAKDYWLFMYLCNGMNMKDLCLLRYSNISGDFLQYERAKTILTNSRPKVIRMALTEDAKAIIKKWGNRKKEGYVFKVLNGKENAEQLRRKVQDTTTFINKKLKKIAEEINITGDLTTYFARHSFATILKRSGANVSFISDALGHSSITTTQNYLAGFEDESLKDAAKALTAFKK